MYYVERAYRTPDYGMWERGTKYNDGKPEIHASSIGNTKNPLVKLLNLSIDFILTRYGKSSIRSNKWL